MGLLGVAVGTVVGMLVRYIFEILFLSKNVLNRPVVKALKMLLTSIGIAALSVALCRYFLPYDAINSMPMWVAFACVSAAVTLLVAMAGYIAIYYKTVTQLLRKVLRKKG